MQLALSVIKTELREGKYAWPGGYPKFFLAADGETLSYEAVHANWREILAAHFHANKHGCQSAPRDWLLVAYDVNWEDTEMRCAHTGARIESAYGDAS